MDLTPVEITGQVIHETVNRGSKSEHDAVVLKPAEGASYVLRRQGGPAFADPELETLVGRSISAEGLSTRNTLIMRKWTTLD